MKNIKKLAVSTLLGVLFFVTPALAATNDYVNYWTFDEGTGRSVNDSIGGQNGVMTGSSTGFGWASGKVGTALGMDGALGTGIVLPDGILKGSEGTISLWFNAQSLSDRSIIFSGKSTSENNIYTALVLDRDGRPTFQFRDSVNGNDRKAQGTKILNKNEWYNIVFTANTLAYHIYINGEDVVVAGENIGRWFPDITNHTLSYRIGMLDATPFSGSWDGYIDDLRIYSRALTLEEVKALYAEGNAKTPTVPAGVAPKVTLAISEDHIPLGGSVALNWTSANVDSCSLDKDSSVTATSGSKVFIKLGSDTSYSISCTGKYGSITSTVKVEVGGLAIGKIINSSSTLVVSGLPLGTTTSKGLHLGRDLRFGHQGEDVHSIQLYFISLGLLPESAATGYFGNLTKAALVKYQKSKGLPSTGYLGKLTRKVLEGN